jgi:hypothetical protein
MAKLSANGLELYRKEGLCKRFSFRSNGWILVNSGGGWKRYRKMRAGRTPLEVAESQEAKDRQRDSDYPAYAEYRALLHLAVSIDHRWGLDSMVSASATDPLNTAADFADKYRYSDCRVVPSATMVRLCVAYLAKERELDVAKSAQAVLSAVSA